MIDIDIPGFGKLELHHAVFDYNGTLAEDGMIGDDIMGMPLKLTGLIREEGCSAAAVQAVDNVVNDIEDAITLLLKPLRFKATLRR